MSVVLGDDGGVAESRASGAANVARWRGRDGRRPLSTRCGPRPRGLGLAPVKGPCRARCRATAQPGGRTPWSSSAAIVAGSYCPFAGIGRCGPPAVPACLSRPCQPSKTTMMGWVNFVEQAPRWCCARNARTCGAAGIFVAAARWRAPTGIDTSHRLYFPPTRCL